MGKIEKVEALVEKMKMWNLKYKIEVWWTFWWWNLRWKLRLLWKKIKKCVEA